MYQNSLNKDIYNTTQEHIKQVSQLCTDLSYINVHLVDTLINLIYTNRRQNMYWCGVGKSGNVASHLSDIFKSINLKSHVLCQLRSTHGDIGLLEPGDIIFLISKSGNTQEIINIIPLLKEKDVLLIGISNNKDSKFSKLCNLHISLPSITELDGGFNLLPTTSIISHIMFGNIIASLYLKKIGFTTKDYGINHCSGDIGKQLLLKANDIMIELDKIALVDKNTTIMNSILEVCAKKSGVAFIIENKQLLGIVTDGDIRRAIKNKYDIDNTSVNSIMTKNPKTVLGIDNIHTMRILLSNNNISCLPVVNIDYEVIGLINNDILLNY